MKSVVPAFFAVILLTTACRHRAPEIISAPEVPSAPLVRALEAQRRNLVSVKAVARVETERRGRRRSYDSVTVVMDGNGRLRIDVYGPLGESLFALLWDGQAVLLRPPGEPEFVDLGQAGLERALGVSLSPAELCAALGGNIIAPRTDDAARAGCESNGRCQVLFPDDRGARRVYALRPAAGTADMAVAEGEDRYEGGRLVYRGKFEERTIISGYSFPLLVSLENPDRALRLVVRYEDVEVNVPVADVFSPGEAR